MTTLTIPQSVGRMQPDLAQKTEKLSSLPWNRVLAKKFSGH